ncbi:flagellar basal-body rod protein FlgB [Liquorilactobacillus aquaticus DSM 21051]|uniref:Flagellar basal body rod protein FlgB n=2 Tax=Liquorilactobacillus aquaticus TaxID=392566 RepID=A0A0R2D0H3_9LACO|nr:flagellar basal body rod protein FlgB [Liquorilactobacillus aquaticus]AJA33774.1 flagellar basal-body rod protein FlgB [Liquorilactobacillus aquaticus]KRM96874.1 flagellar basal-body rod protein FlgB [Liquorilactobacillus aquaticus DSM 21051]
MGTYDLLKQAMDVSSTRSQLISSNIANVNTANYKAKSVDFENQLNKALGSDGFSLATTNKRHLQSSDLVTPTIKTNSGTSVKENGNNVDLDVEMMNQATNGLYYSALVSQLNGRYQMMNYVLNH